MTYTITPQHERYPELLKQIHDPPELLYVRGTLPPRDALCLAVVGSRKATMYGARAIDEIVEPIARSGVVIVSGLAYGIDALAHRAALKAGGVTVAVLGSEVDERGMMPSGHRELAREIIERGGAIISEYPAGTRVEEWHFPVRNRIIAGMSQATLVVEAAVKSGSLITAKAANDAGRDVFAVPGSIALETCAGPNNLIKMGARVATCPEDILSVLGVTNASEPKTIPVAGSPTEAKILEILTRNPLHVDDIARAAGLPISTATSTLTLMEMKGSARHMGGMHYARG